MIAGKIQVLPPEKDAVSVPEIVEQLIQQAERASASDIHLQMTEGEAVVSFRLDGLMAPATRYVPVSMRSGSTS